MYLNLKKIKMIAFDWDGTLVNSLDEVVIAFQSACKDFSIPVPDTQSVRKNIGMGHEEIWEKLSHLMGEKIKTPNRKEFWECFYNYYQPENVKVFDSVRRSLDTIINHGLAVAIVTNKPSFSFFPEVDDLDLRTYFIDCLCADQYIEKPDPMMLSVLSARHNLTPENILMVGDTTFDIDAANAFGCQSVAVLCGNMKESELAISSPTLMINHVGELAEYIEKEHPLVEDIVFEEEYA